MKRYEFRLATLLRIRRIEEEQAKLHFTRANARLRERLQARDADRARCRSLSAGTGETSLSEFRAERLVSELAATSLAAAERAANEAAGEVAHAHLNWLATARRVSVIERLDERRRIEYAAAANRAEITEVDDLVTSRFVTSKNAAAQGVAS